VSYIDPFGLDKESVNEGTYRPWWNPIFVVDLSYGFLIPIGPIGGGGAGGVSVFIDFFAENWGESIGLGVWRVLPMAGVGGGGSVSANFGLIFGADSVTDAGGRNTMGSVVVAKGGGINVTATASDQYDVWGITIGPAAGAHITGTTGVLRYSEIFVLLRGMYELDVNSLDLDFELRIR